ncbi:TIGR03086 family metal-binding protein [Fodinicola acaciae]|uniref:TIGR03086 family metal-binding protein n=1 Tax=Fodinicola acaciae TaxID=2681555 RepID=UPI0013D6A694|nr:TIGR03086 family metal-binding protein [Fodinicola acaciae]
MTVAYPAAELAYGIGLLERALSYALGTVRDLAGDPLIGPTPCQRWNLRQLVCHLNESLAALQEGIEGGSISPPEPEVGAADPVIAFRQAATRLLGCWARSEGEPITVAGCPLTAITVATTGAIEVAVHGWDVSQATGRRQPVPAPLARDLLPIVPMVISDADRPVLFGPAVTPPLLASPGDQLVALLGRDPWT